MNSEVLSQITIREAISRSISHEEIVHVEVTGDIHDLIMATQVDGWDWSRENDGSMDVYSTDDHRGDSWRINVTGATE